MTQAKKITTSILFGFLAALALGGILRTKSPALHPPRVLDAVFHHDSDEPQGLNSRTVEIYHVPSPMEDLHRTEDARNVYFALDTSFLNPETLETTISNGYVTVSGDVDSSLSGDSQYTRTFPVPENVNIDRAQVTHHRKQMFFRFPKSL